MAASALSFDAAEPAIPTGARTLGEELERIAPGWSWGDLCRWPPDAFAATAALLAESGAYRCVVCPPGAHCWPPAHLLESGERWETVVRRSGAEWAAWAGKNTTDPLPSLAPLYTILEAARGMPLGELDDERAWVTLTALLALHAIADEASTAAGLVTDTVLQHRAAALLAHTGSLSHLDPERVRILPKLRAPEPGITLRSLSHHLALDRSEVDTRWCVAERRSTDADTARARLTLLLVPYPATVHASDFRPVAGPLLDMGESGYSFYDFVPEEAVDPGEIVELVERAHAHVGPIDGVVLPEAALDETAADKVGYGPPAART